MRIPFRCAVCWRLALAAASLVMALSAWGQDPAPPFDPPPGEAAVPPSDAVPAGEPSAEAVPDEPAAPPEDPAARAFMMKCIGCHTIGGGPLSGPDLKASAGYPRQTVWDAIKRMEKNVGPLTDDDIDMLTDFLHAPDAADRVQAYRDRVEMMEAASLEPPDAAKGRDLFFGRAVLQNRGQSCAACHQAGARGGNLAASLEDAYTRLGEASILATTENPGFPVMRAIYADRPVTRQEALHITKYLEEVAQSPADGLRVPLHLAGLFGAAVLTVLLGRPRGARAAGTRARLVAAAKQRGGRRGRTGGTHS